MESFDEGTRRNDAGRAKEYLVREMVALDCTNFPQYAHLTAGASSADLPSSDPTKPHMDIKSHETSTVHLSLRNRRISANNPEVVLEAMTLNFSYTFGCPRQLALATAEQLGLFDITPCVSSKSLFVFELSSPAARQVLAQRLVKSKYANLTAGLVTRLPDLYADRIAGSDRVPLRTELLTALNAIFAVDDAIRVMRPQMRYSFVTEIVCSNEVKALMESTL